MMCNHESCGEETMIHNIELADEYLREAMADSPHLTVSFTDLILAVILAMHHATGIRYTLDDMSSVLAEATARIDRAEDRARFEAEALSGISDIPVADKEPRVILTRGDVEMISQRVADLLRDKVTEGNNV